MLKTYTNLSKQVPVSYAPVENGVIAGVAGECLYFTGQGEKRGTFLYVRAGGEQRQLFALTYPPMRGEASQFLRSGVLFTTYRELLEPEPTSVSSNDVYTYYYDIASEEFHELLKD